MKNPTLSCRLLFGLVLLSGPLAAQPTLKPVHQRAVMNLLKVYETNVNALVLRLGANPEKDLPGLASFQKTLFVPEKPLIYNHVAVTNLRLDSLTTNRMKQDFLPPPEFLRLGAGVFKKNFSYKLNFGGAVLRGQASAPDTAQTGIVESRLAQVFIGVVLTGSNGALQIRQTDSLRIDVEYAVTSSRNVVPARIVRIVKAVGGPTPPSEAPVTPVVAQTGLKAKVDSLMHLIELLVSARDTQAVQYQTYRRQLPRLVGEESRYHLRMLKDTTERRIYATEFARIDSLRTRKYQFDKALIVNVSIRKTGPDKPSRVTTDYYFDTTFKGGEMQYRKHYKVVEDSERPRFPHDGWWIDELWLRELPANKPKPSPKDTKTKQ